MLKMTRKLLSCLLVAMMLVTMAPPALVTAEEFQEPDAIQTEQTGAPQETEPGEDPTAEPTDEVTVEPTDEVTVEPTDEVTVEPTDEATVEPTDEASVEPTDEATVEPTDETTVEPTDEATVEPTDEATVEPTDETTVEPTDEATGKPTGEASVEPTDEASVEPTGEASVEPTGEATVEPTDEATGKPTEEVTIEPTAEPEETPTGNEGSEMLPNAALAMGGSAEPDALAVALLSVSISGAPTGTTSAPSITLTAKATTGVDVTSSTEFQWYVDGSKMNGATSKSYSLILADGTYGSKVVKVIASYKIYAGIFYIGTITGEASVTINYDRRPLAITNAAYTGGYSGGWTKNDVGISFSVVSTAHDLSSVTVNGTPLTLRADGNYTATISTEGNSAVTIVATDAADNSVTNTDLRTKIDKTAPTINASADPNDWTDDLSVAIHASASDSLSGFDKLEYRMDEIAWIPMLLGGNTFDTLAFLSHKYEFRATDKVGNVSDVTTVYAKIDHIAPIYEVDVDPIGWSNDANGVKITVKNIVDGIDNLTPVFFHGSGVASVHVGSETLTDDGNGNYVYYATTEGMTSYEVSVSDVAGNSREIMVVTFYDISAPSYKVSVEPASWTNDGQTGVKITVYDVTDKKTGVNIVSGLDSVKIGDQTVQPDGDGKYAVVCKTEGKTSFPISVKDKAGNEATETVYAYIDVTKPSFACKLSDSDWTKDDVTITIYDISDANGQLDVSDIKSVTVDGNAATLANGEYTYVVSAEGEIKHTISVKDNAGNETTDELTTKIDKTAPTFNLSEDETDWTNEDVTISITGISDANGQLDVSDIKSVTVDGNAATMVSATEYSYTISAEGEIEHKVVVTDNAGNKTEKKITTKIDKTAPAYDLDGEEDWTNQDVTLTISNVSDEKDQVATTNQIVVSGIDKISVDGDETNVLYDSNTDTYSYVVSEEGKVEHTVLVTDVAGNKTEKKITTKIDKTAPTYGLSEDETDWTNEDVTISITSISDANGQLDVSDIKSVTVDGNDATMVSATEYSYVVSEEGEIEHTVLVTDNAGNETEKKITTKIDKTAPAYDLDGDEDWTNQDVTLTISNVSDEKDQVAMTTKIAVSGIDKISVDGDETNVLYDSNTDTYSYVISEEGEIEHTVLVTDVAGNKTEKKVTTRIDKTAPTAKLSSDLTLNPGATWTSQESVTVTIKAEDEVPNGVQVVSGLETEYIWFMASNQIAGQVYGWTSNAELTLHFDKSGVYTVYPVVRDVAGNRYEMDPFTVNYVSDDLTLTIASPITSRTTQVEVGIEETATNTPANVGPAPDYYVGPGASTDHEVDVALTLKMGGTEVSDPTVYFVGAATIKMGGTGTVTFQARPVNDAASGLSWTDYLPAGGVVTIGTVTDSLSLDVIPGTAQSLTFDPVTVDRTEGAIDLAFEGKVGGMNWMKDGITITGLAGEVVRIVVTDANSATDTYYKKLDGSGTAVLTPDEWWHAYDDSTKSHNDKTIAVGYVDIDDLYNGEAQLTSIATAQNEETVDTFWYMYKAYDDVATVATENRGKTLDINVPESDMKITSITFDGVEYLAAAVDANVGTTYTLSKDLLDWWKIESGLALSGRKCWVAVTTVDAAGNTATTTLKADVSESDVPIKFAVKPDLVENANYDYSLMNGRSTVTIKGTANEYETLNVKIGSYHTTVKVGGTDNYTLGQKGWFSLTVDTADLNLPTDEPFEITISYRDIEGKPFSQYVLYDGEISPILLTVTPNDRSGVRGIVEPGATVQMIYGGVTYEATVDEYGLFFFEGQDITLVAGEEVKIIATDIFGNTVSKVFTVVSGMTTVDLYTVGKTFLYEAKEDDETLDQLSGFASTGTDPGAEGPTSVWFSATPVTQEDLASGTFEIPLLLANQYVVGKVIITKQADGTYVGSYEVDEALAATVNADQCSMNVAYTGEVERLSTTGDTETAVKVQPEAKDFMDATAVGFGSAFRLDFDSYEQTWIIAKVQIELDTATLASLIPLSDDLLELYETYQLNN